MTGRDPLAKWWAQDCPSNILDAEDWCTGANARLEALRPLIDAADLLADAVHRHGEDEASWGDVLDALSTYRNLTTSKGDTP